MEKRRMQAADLFRRGVIPAEIARRLGFRHDVCSAAHPLAVASPFFAAFDLPAHGVRLCYPDVAYAHPLDGGRAALRGAGRAGRRPRLSRAQLAKVQKTLLRGAEASGYLTDVWTLPRVAEVIERLTGVAYHPGHVWYILRDQLRWSWQRPARRAVERDEAAIEQWVELRWPQIKKEPGASTR